jgi:hypothetical protein
MRPSPTSSDPELAPLRTRSRLHTWLLISGALAVPLPLVTIHQHQRLSSWLAPCGLAWPLELHALACLTGAVTFGWIMLVPLLVWGQGWRQQCACVVALFLVLQTLGTLHLLALTFQL